MDREVLTGRLLAILQDRCGPDGDACTLDPAGLSLTIRDKWPMDPRPTLAEIRQAIARLRHDRMIETRGNWNGDWLCSLPGQGETQTHSPH